MAENLLIVISGPSGVGKGTIVEKITEQLNMIRSVSCTTRPMRESEADGREYFFLSKEQFEDRIKEGGFLEYSNHFDNYYGTPFSFVTENLQRGDVVLEIDINGALAIKNSFSEAILILIAPPSMAELRKRLTERNTESEQDIENRVERASFELANFKKYDYVVINRELDKAIKEVKCIICAEKRKSQNMKDEMRIILEV